MMVVASGSMAQPRAALGAICDMGWFGFVDRLLLPPLVYPPTCFLIRAYPVSLGTIERYDRIVKYGEGRKEIAR